MMLITVIIYLGWLLSLAYRQRKNVPNEKSSVSRIDGLWSFVFVRMPLLVGLLAQSAQEFLYAVLIYTLAIELVLLCNVMRRSTANARIRPATQAGFLYTAHSEQLRLEMILSLRNHELLKAITANAEAEREKIELMTRIGHDLRAPMTAIMGYADVIAHRHDQLRLHTLNIARSCNKVLRLIDDLMKYARDSDQPRALQTQSLHLPDFLKGVAAQANLLQPTQQEIKRLEESIRVITKALESTVRSQYRNRQAKSDLLARVDSSLRVPVDRIIRDAELIVLAGRGEIVHQEIILRSALRLQRLVDDLIQHSQAEKKLDFIQSHVDDISILIKGIADKVEEFAKINDNRFDFIFIGVAPPKTNINTKMLGQVLLELLSNAAKRVKNGQIVLQVETNRRQPTGTLNYLFKVSYAGQYVDIRKESTVFEAFGRLKKMDSSQKLNLVIARRWVKLMGGELVFDSELGQGTTITLLIPVQIAEESQGPNSSLESRPIKVQINVRKFPRDIVRPRPEILSMISVFISMGAISDLIDWANSSDSKNASWSSFAKIVAELASNGDLQGLATLLGTNDVESVQIPAAIDRIH